MTILPAITIILHIIKCTPYGSHTDNPIKDLCGAQIPNPYGPSVGCIRACPYRTHTDKLIWAFLGTQAMSPYQYHELRPIDRLLPLSHTVSIWACYLGHTCVLYGQARIYSTLGPYGLGIWAPHGSFMGLP